MALSAERRSPTTGYPALFRNFIANSLSFVLADIQGASKLSEQQRQEALRSLEYGLAPSAPFPQAIALALALAPFLLRSGHWQECQTFLQRARTAASTPAERAGLAYQLGDLAQTQGHFADAETALVESIADFATNGHLYEQARAMNRLAYVWRACQRQDEAEALALQAQSLLAPAESEWGYSHFVLGVIAFDRQRHQTAADHLQAALDCWEGNGQEERRADGLLNLAPALRRLRRYDEAIACLQEAGHIYARRGVPRFQALVHLNLSNIHLSLAQWEEARTHALLAEGFFRRTVDRLHQAINYNNLGVACRRLGRLGEAERAFQLAIGGLESLDQPWHHINALDGLGNTLRDGGRLAEAVAAYETALSRAAATRNPSRFASLTAEVREHLEALPTLQLPKPSPPPSWGM